MTSVGSVALLTGLVTLGGVAFTVVRKARSIARLTARVEADKLEPRSTFPTVVVVPARHLRTALSSDAVRLDWIARPSRELGELGLTDRELVLAAAGVELLRIPLRRVLDAAFVAALGNWQAGERLSLLRVVWVRGGERLVTTFGVETPWTAAEKLRRELHFRISIGRSEAGP